MKKAFTLIELLIVVAVLVTLMGLMFKLGAVGGDSYRRTRTITRMQKLENCLSGYNAAFGSYPPVKLHASRNINSRIDNYGHGMQTGESGEPNWNDEGLAWDQVQAACLAQPVACRFPFPDGPYNELIRGISTEMKRRAGETGNEHYRKYWGNERIKKKLEAGFESVNMNAGGLDDLGRAIGIVGIDLHAKAFGDAGNVAAYVSKGQDAELLSLELRARLAIEEVADGKDEQSEDEFGHGV